MRISTFAYTFKQGFKNIFRNKIFSLATIATIAACVFLFGLFGSELGNGLALGCGCLGIDVGVLEP